MLLQNAIADTLNNTEWAFALAECVHIGGFAISVGTIALVDFRMLNLGLREETAARILRYTEPWTLIALVLVMFSGFALFLSQTSIYLVNLIFPIKMYVLVAALIYNFTVHRRVATMKNPPPGLSKVVASVSLLLWVAVVFGGLFTGFLI
jgi:small-conductance mechanosensitive channel